MQKMPLLSRAELLTSMLSSRSPEFLLNSSLPEFLSCWNLKDSHIHAVPPGARCSNGAELRVQRKRAHLRFGHAQTVPRLSSVPGPYTELDLCLELALVKHGTTLCVLYG